VPVVAPTAAAPTAAPTPTPVPFATIGDGQHVVGQDVQAGTYRTQQGSPGCYWERDKNFLGGVDSILANDNTDNPAIVRILKTDVGFTSTNCGTWTSDLSQITTSKSQHDDGNYIVGTDLTPGTWKSRGGAGCYWERESAFTGARSELHHCQQQHRCPRDCDRTGLGQRVQLDALRYLDACLGRRAWYPHGENCRDHPAGAEEAGRVRE
jgi:hypothetical protein